MRPNYRDVFLKAERFAFICDLCGATIVQDALQLHSDDHERRDYEKWSKNNGE